MAQMQKQLLETTVETELLKEQLANIKNRGPSPPPLNKRRSLSPSADLHRSLSPPPLAQPATLAALAPNVVLMTPLVSPPVQQQRYTAPKAPQLATPLRKAEGEIDESHPGGVKTLKRAFESKMQAVTPAHFKPYVRHPRQVLVEPESPPPKTEEKKDEKDEKKEGSSKKGVKFADSVEEIPDSGDYDDTALSPRSPDMTTSTPVYPQVPPVPPPSVDPSPAPPAEPPRAWMGSLIRPGKHLKIIDRSGNERVVKAGRTMLPPPVPAEPPVTFVPRSQPVAQQQESQQPPEVRI